MENNERNHRSIDEGKVALCFLFLIILLGAFLRIYSLSNKSLRLDEFFSIRDSQSFSAFVNTGHPPLFFIILHFFRYMGNEEFFLRLPSVIFGIKEGLIAAFFLSISTFHIDYSQETRMYTLFTFLSMLSLFFLYKALKENKKEFWAGFTLSTALVLYTHYFAVLVVLVEGILSITFLIHHMLKDKNKPSIKTNFFALVLSYVLVSLLYMPWIFKRFHLFAEATTTGISLSWFRGIPPQPSFYMALFSDFGVGEGIALGIFLFFFLCGIIASARDLEGISLLLWIGLPIVLVTIMSTLLSPVIGVNSLRYLIFILPIYLLIISRGIVSVAKVAAMQIVRLIKKPEMVKKITFSTIVVIVILLSSISYTPLQTYYSEKREDWRGAGHYLDTYSQSGDIIVVEPAYLKECLLYYYDNNSKNNTVLTVQANVTKLIDICSGNDRVWIVLNARYAKNHPTVKNWLYDNFGLGKEFSGDIHVFLKQQTSFRAAIFGHFEWDAQIPWGSMLSLMSASISTFNDKTDISSVNLADFDLVVFADFMRPPSEAESLYLKESIQNGLRVIVSGLSPYYLAGGTENLTKISSWFGATVISDAPREARWNVKFTESAIEIIEELDLEHEYTFYIDSDWTTPTGCVTQPKAVIYAYRQNDQVAAIFLHKFGNGTSTFIGPRFGFDSPDAETFDTFLKSLILSLLE